MSEYLKKREEFVMQQFKSKDYVTISLVIANIAVYIFCTIQGDMLYNMGSLSVVDIIDRQEYYRVLTSMFLHAGPQHIWGNMIFLAALGDMLERSIGHGRFFTIYMLAGIGGNLLSMGRELVTGQFCSTVGASGAVFGLIGALILFICRNNGNYGEVSLRRMILALVYLFYSGMQSETTNNAAHLGGFVVGFIVMAVFYCIERRKYQKY
mgnify:FL=1